MPKKKKMKGIMSKPTMAKDIPVKDMDEEVGMMKGMCKMVASKK